MPHRIRRSAVALFATCAVAWFPVAGLADSCQFSAEGDPAPHPIGGWQGRCTTSQGYQCSLFDGTPTEHTEILYVVTDPRDKNLVPADPNILTMIVSSNSLPTDGAVSLSAGGRTLSKASYKHSNASFNDVDFTLDRRTPIFKSSNVTVHVGPWKRVLNFASLHTDSAVTTIVDCAANYHK